MLCISCAAAVTVTGLQEETAQTTWCQQVSANQNATLAKLLSCVTPKGAVSAAAL